MSRAIHNIGAEIATIDKLLVKAMDAGYVGAGQVAINEIAQILDRLLALDARTPLRFSVQTAELTDDEIGEVTGSQSRLVGEWWIDVPESMPLAPGVRHQQADAPPDAP